MKKHSPLSVQNDLRWLDKCHGDIEANATEIAKILNTPGPYLQDLEALNTITEGHGVESIDGDNGPLIHYVEQGDLYTPTFVYDHFEKKIVICTAGDWLEVYERDNPVTFTLECEGHGSNADNALDDLMARLGAYGLNVEGQKFLRRAVTGHERD